MASAFGVLPQVSIGPHTWSRFYLDCGTVESKVYENDAQNRPKADRPFAEGTATPVRSGVWAAL
jgi:hypothetical protein